MHVSCCPQGRQCFIATLPGGTPHSGGNFAVALHGPSKGPLAAHPRWGTALNPARPSAGTARAAAPPDASAASPAVVAADAWVEVGIVGPPHGVRGEMKVQPVTDFPEDRLATPGARWLQAPPPKLGRRRAPPPVEVELEWGRASVSKGRQVWLVKLLGVDCPEDVGPLRGHRLLIPAAARAPLADEDEFYVQDLVGLRVVMAATGEEVGKVVDLFDGTGSHDVLRIQLLPGAVPSSSNSSSSGEEEEDAAQEAAAGTDSSPAGSPSMQAAPSAAIGPLFVLLPFAKALVPVVDLAGGRLEILPPEGLFELATPSAGAGKGARRESAGVRERRNKPKSAPRPRTIEAA